MKEHVHLELVIVKKGLLVHHVKQKLPVKELHAKMTEHAQVELANVKLGSVEQIVKQILLAHQLHVKMEDLVQKVHVAA
eukprot:CAMPEP_0117022358 /NCGR_PEP_ID=MMETSP0472-20121206/16808_1 /TAXON_ID=693140 ORGANISM="Tiarina fusus, Strain LIS" /NCGR_SAMPLE_ID=MMETSP0472 /ASSEMBLY_ACC=CAM_ASM_000603 /LENGTH=78 /DNA_ID=CAMNT_0004728187 /DNA_START=519 /DNA_END=755 /DNA_ORIENTATION=+